MRGLGTIVNVGTITVGGLAGVYVGHLLPEQMRRTIMQGSTAAERALGS